MFYVLVLALSKRNTNVSEIIIYLHRLVQVLIEYFKELEEESIRDNFVIIYELLDEMMDFGFPQTTESKILQEYVCKRVQRSHWVHPLLPGTLPRNRTSWKSKFAPHHPSPMPFPGDLKAFGTAKTKCSWMLSRVSTYWYVPHSSITQYGKRCMLCRSMPMELSFVQKFWVQSK